MAQPPGPSSAPDPSDVPGPSGAAVPGTPPARRGLITVSWLWVGLPLAYGVYELVRKATQLFTG
ncbi:hypothetical protein GBW32_30435 [Streptomyces tsukubensis]|uniref:Uncharacterized protein n=1 Tax=Streptomyces tsukubensis TaxID=83656 RepID=A0A1V4ACS4_9ACTN|nr:hypothetical protein [Streptomyces tsukubensis]OON81774.1 hypothetical protein B1H18_06570 [Streptomyces tsukubensis]QFR96562.1 hypothetical protein GBW32_30435 [Streptomyces tsukubensis]